MLAGFLRVNRPAILGRSKSLLSSRASPPPTNEELNQGIPLFLDQLEAALERAESGKSSGGTAMVQSAGRHGETLQRLGLTIAQVVQDYGDVCQTITELAVEQKAPISLLDFQTLNLCLDEAISGAVTSYARHREQEIAGKTRELVSGLAHDLRTNLQTALLTFENIRAGRVPVKGSTGLIHLQSLLSLQMVVARTVTAVRLDAGTFDPAPVLVQDLMEEVEIGATIEARAREVQFTAHRPPDRALSVMGDRQLLSAALINLVHNALRFTPPHESVTLTALPVYDRVHFTVEDKCGGIPRDQLERIFQPGGPGEGAGQGLNIARRAAEANGGTLSVRNSEDKGCIFTLDLPRLSPR